MNVKDPRAEPASLSDEDLMVELGVAVGSLTALEMALERGAVKPEAVNDVRSGIREWALRADRLEREIADRGFSVVITDDPMGFYSRLVGKG